MGRFRRAACGVLVVLGVEAGSGNGLFGQTAGNWTVTVGELAHEVPGSAVREFRAAMRAWNHHLTTNAMDHLLKAIAIDPQLAPAHNNLGLMQLERGNLPDAEEQFGAAIAIEPRVAIAYYNLALTYRLENRLRDAEMAARQAIDREHPAQSDALYLLGSVLLMEGRQIDEALKFLRRSAREYPVAHLVIAEALANQGDNADAQQEVSEYLSSGNKKFRAAAFSRLAEHR